MDRISESNKALVLEAFDTLFNKRDYAAAETSGCRATFNTVLISRQVGKACSNSSRACRQYYGRHRPRTFFELRSVRELDRRRYSSHRGRILVEHWDVIQNEATRESSKSGEPMFGDMFPK
jgi:hypothetical protein